MGGLFSMSQTNNSNSSQPKKSTFRSLYNKGVNSSGKFINKMKIDSIIRSIKSYKRSIKESFDYRSYCMTHKCTIVSKKDIKNSLVEKKEELQEYLNKYKKKTGKEYNDKEVYQLIKKIEELNDSYDRGYSSTIYYKNTNLVWRDYASFKKSKEDGRFYVMCQKKDNTNTWERCMTENGKFIEVERINYQWYLVDSFGNPPNNQSVNPQNTNNNQSINPQSTNNPSTTGGKKKSLLKKKSLSKKKSSPKKK
jgi:hypothetical protein